MRASVLKTANRSESRNDKNLGIQTYGENNDYPQRVKEISDASGTGKSCIGIYAKFIAGRGFADQDFYQAQVNEQGQTNDYLLSQIVKDFAAFSGFALHVNYNALCQIVEVQHVPFETIRFEKLDDEGKFCRLATHPDWGRRNQALRRFKKEDITFYDLYNPNPEAIAEQVELAGGWDEYNGQIFYHSEAGAKTYPTPVYDSVLTDMSTEEGIANLKLRNSRFGFFTSGMVVDKRNEPQNDDQENELEQSLLEFQGDENAGKLVYVSVGSEEEIPMFIPLDTKNYDKEFSYTEESTQQNIGRAFNQPPILRSEDVGAGFGAELMTNAYDAYNSVTATERIAIERVFAEIYSHFAQAINPTDTYTIAPLSYEAQLNAANIPTEMLAVLTHNEKRALLGLPELTDKQSKKPLLSEKIGTEGVQAMVSITADPALSADQKRTMLELLFNLTPKETEQLIPNSKK